MELFGLIIMGGSILCGFIIIATTKEQVINKEGIVKFSYIYEEYHKHSRYSAGYYTSHAVFTCGDAEHKFTKNLGETNRLSAIDIDVAKSVHNHTDYQVITRTNYFMRTPFIHRVECKLLDNLYKS